MTTVSIKLLKRNLEKENKQLLAHVNQLKKVTEVLKAELAQAKVEIAQAKFEHLRYEHATTPKPIPAVVVNAQKHKINEQAKEIASIRDDLKDAYSKLSNFENERVANKRKLGNQRKELKIKAEKIEELKKQNENFRKQLQRRGNIWGGFY